MNTHSDGLYGTLSTLYKRKTLVRLESATPAVDRPVAKVELMQVREVMLFLSLRLTTVPSCHASSFIKPKQYKMDLQTKRNYKGYFTVYTKKTGNSVPVD